MATARLRAALMTGERFARRLVPASREPRVGLVSEVARALALVARATHRTRRERAGA